MTQAVQISRFAPSTTGPAHPGTLLAALLCWLDARACGARVILRLEDLDPSRARPEWTDGLVRDLEWLGLDWDEVTSQAAARDQHEQALDRLDGLGVLYPCSCTRKQIASEATPTADGGYRYPGTCRSQRFGPGGWRACEDSIRVRLPDEAVVPVVFLGEDLARNPFRDFGDPVVRRRDGVAAYQLASVVDDASAGVTRIVRGRDLAFHTATQVALQQMLELPSPEYGHHFLLLERAEGRKLGKLHGAVSIDQLRPSYPSREFCGWLAHAAGLREDAAALSPADLLNDFEWRRVRQADRVVRWTADRLMLES